MIVQGPQEQTRQFGIGSLLTVTLMYALLFGRLRSLTLNPVVFGVMTAGFTMILIGRLMLFGGRRPLTASVIVGVCIGVICCTLALLGLFSGFVPTPFSIAFEYVGFVLPLVGVPGRPAARGYLEAPHVEVRRVVFG